MEQKLQTWLHMLKSREAYLYLSAENAMWHLPCPLLVVHLSSIIANHEGFSLKNCNHSFLNPQLQLDWSINSQPSCPLSSERFCKKGAKWLFLKKFRHFHPKPNNIMYFYCVMRLSSSQPQTTTWLIHQHKSCKNMMRAGYFWRSYTAFYLTTNIVMYFLLHYSDQPFLNPLPQFDWSINSQLLHTPSCERFCKNGETWPFLKKLQSFLSNDYCLHVFFTALLWSAISQSPNHNLTDPLTSNHHAHQIVTDSVKTGEIWLYLKKLHSFYPMTDNTTYFFTSLLWLAILNPQPQFDWFIISQPLCPPSSKRFCKKVRFYNI